MFNWVPVCLLIVLPNRDTFYFWLVFYFLFPKTSVTSSVCSSLNKRAQIKIQNLTWLFRCSQIGNLASTQSCPRIQPTLPLENSNWISPHFYYNLKVLFSDVLKYTPNIFSLQKLPQINVKINVIRILLRLFYKFILLFIFHFTFVEN